MNPAIIAIRKQTITLVLTVLLVVLGILAYCGMPRLEDPEFTIKSAIVLTPYPGGSAAEVAEEVSNVIEMAAQELAQLDRVESRSERGLSTVRINILDSYDRHQLPQVWDEMRRKVNDAQRNLPPGAGPSIVIDNFGDVYGVLFALTGPDFSMAELYETAKMLQRELLLVDDVKKVELSGVQTEVIYIEMQRDRMSSLGIHPNQVAAALREQNLVVPSGRLDVGPLAITIDPTGEWTGTGDFENLIIRGDTAGALVFLRDIATVRRDFIDPPAPTLLHNGTPAIGIGISTVAGGNVVTMGEGIKQRLAQLEGHIPLGKELHAVAFQAEAVTTAINEFVANLIAAVVIVFVVLLVAMGIRSGLIIGLVLLITMCGTFLAMQFTGTILERISLGALIIALGMLVDNAIVITEGMLMAIRKGVDRLQAARDVVARTAIPLLGSTAIAILAFGAIGLSEDNAGEITRSLFVVLLLALGMSWITAVTITPLFGYLFLKKGASGDAADDPYAGPVYQGYRRLLLFCLGRPVVFLGLMAALLGGSIYAFRFVDQSFFPESTREQFMVDVWLPANTRIDQTIAASEKIRKEIAALPGVTHITTTVGRGAPRFLLTYSPERLDSGYAQFIVDVDDRSHIEGALEEVRRGISPRFPDALLIPKRFLLGPGDGGRIQARFSGKNHDMLRELAAQAKQILNEDGGAMGVRLDCREKVPILRPQFAEAPARLAGITRSDLGRALETAFSGRAVGVYRERDNRLPIIARAPASERVNADFIRDQQVFSPVADGFIPIRQIVSDFTVAFEDPIIERRDRMPTITVHADQATGLASQLHGRVKERIEAIPLPDGYTLEWGGEYEKSATARASVLGALPPFVILMVLIVIALFNCLRTTAIIWLVVPLSLIGIVFGLLLFGQPFGFMALLGALSLSGMLIKNAIVLIDEINSQIGEGKHRWDAMLDASVSRVRPVSMAALTTMLGLLPLFFDVFFGAMAVTIICGLAFATALTLLVVPVLFTVFFRIRPPARA